MVVNKYMTIIKPSRLLIYLAVFIVLMCFNLKYCVECNKSLDLPPPPVKPDHFKTKQDLKDYLVKLHEYYAIIGRPRFGRNALHDSPIYTNHRDNQK